MIKEPIYIYVSQSAHFINCNSGIQRTIRQLAKGLLDIGVNLVPLKEEIGTGKILACEKEDLHSFAKYDGPKESSWNQNYFNGDLPVKNAKYLINADLTWHNTKSISDFCKKNNIKMYSIFYDGIPITLKKLFPNEHEMHQKYLDELAMYSNGVMPISESAKKEFIEYMTKNTATNIKTILLPNELSNIRPPRKVNKTNTIDMLYVSTTNQRKNHIRLLQAYRMAKAMLLEEHYSLNLTLVGEPMHEEAVIKIRQAVKNDGVIWHHNVSDEDLKKLYLNSDFTIYPSEYEGYGLPVIESLSMNTPVICSNTSSLPEIASGGGCLMFDPYNIPEMARMIYRMARNQDLRDKLVSQIDNIPHRSWNDYAMDIVKFMETN